MISVSKCSRMPSLGLTHASLPMARRARARVILSQDMVTTKALCPCFAKNYSKGLNGYQSKVRQVASEQNSKSRFRCWKSTMRSCRTFRLQKRTGSRMVWRFAMCQVARELMVSSKVLVRAGLRWRRFRSLVARTGLWVRHWWMPHRVVLTLSTRSNSSKSFLAQRASQSVNWFPTLCWLILQVRKEPMQQVLHPALWLTLQLEWRRAQILTKVWRPWVVLFPPSQSSVRPRKKAKSLTLSFRIVIQSWLMFWSPSWAVTQRQRWLRPYRQLTSIMTKHWVHWDMRGRSKPLRTRLKLTRVHRTSWSESSEKRLRTSEKEAALEVMVAWADVSMTQKHKNSNVRWKNKTECLRRCESSKKSGNAGLQRQRQLSNKNKNKRKLF